MISRARVHARARKAVSVRSLHITPVQQNTGEVFEIVRKQLFDDLPPEVREALATAIAPSDQMIEVLCTMHQSGFALSDLLRVISASNANSSR